MGSIKHTAVTGAPADSTALVDGPAWDAAHSLTNIAQTDQANTFLGAQTITPTTGTTNQGFIVTQTSQSSGTVAGPILFNKTDVTNSGVSASGSGWDAFGQQNLIYSHRFTMSITGATSGAGSSALGAITNIAASADGFGSASGATITGANPAGHNAWGHIAYGIGFVNSQIGVLIGSEGEVGVGTGGTVGYRVAVSANSQGPVKGTTLDAAFAASTITSHIPGSGTTSSPFEHLMALSGNIYGSSQLPITTTGDFFYSDTAGTVAHFANLANITVTGNILSFPNMGIGGSGAAIFGGPASNLSTGVIATAASAGTAQIFGQPDGVAGFDGLTSITSGQNNILFTGVAEASNTATRFGQTIGNWGLIRAVGSSNVGLAIGTDGAFPLILGTNNTARITIAGAGGVTISGHTTLEGVTSTGATGTGKFVFDASPTFTGTPLAPTAAVDTNTTQIATTAMVLAQAGSATPVDIANTAVVGTSTRFARADHTHAYDSTAWATYTPTVTSTGGTPTTVSATGRYKQRGKTIHLQVVVTITNHGTATGQVFATLPTNASSGNPYSGSTYESSVTGKSGACVITSGNSTRLQTSDATAATWWVDGYILVIGMTYEIP